MRFESGWCSRYFMVETEVIGSDGKEFMQKDRQFVQHDFDGVLE